MGICLGVSRPLSRAVGSRVAACANYTLLDGSRNFTWHDVLVIYLKKEKNCYKNQVLSELPLHLRSFISVVK